MLAVEAAVAAAVASNEPNEQFPVKTDDWYINTVTLFFFSRCKITYNSTRARLTVTDCVDIVIDLFCRSNPADVLMSLP